jgi:hypothetical protein
VTPLSGKIFFRNLKWTTKNDTISIFRGYLVVRHWITNCRTNEEEGVGPDSVPARFGLYFEGFEWFIYNRTAVYYLIEDLLEQEQSGLGTSKEVNEVVGATRVLGAWTPGRQSAYWILKLLPLPHTTNSRRAAANGTPE